MSVKKSGAKTGEKKELSPTVPETIRKIKQLRVERKMTTNRLAELCGYSQSHLWSLEELNDTSVSLDCVDKMCEGAFASPTLSVFRKCPTVFCIPFFYFPSFPWLFRNNWFRFGAQPAKKRKIRYITKLILLTRFRIGRRKNKRTGCCASNRDSVFCNDIY